MGVVMKQFIDRFKAIEKVANETLAANPEALVGVDSLPGSEHDAKVPEDAKKPDEEVTQGQPAGATSTEGAVVGGDAKVLNEGKLEMDQPLTNPEKKPLISDDALTAKVANDHLASLVNDLLSDLKSGNQKQASENKTDNQSKSAAPRQKIALDDETISKIAAAQAAFMSGHNAAESVLNKAASASPAKDARALIKAACIKAAQDQGLDQDSAALAAENAMAAAGIPGEGDASSQAPEIPADVTEEELATAIVDLVSSGELDPDTAKAIVEEIASDEAASAGDDEAAEIIAEGIASGEITPEQASEIIYTIENGDADELQGAADAEAAISDAVDEAQGAADADAAISDAVDEAQGAEDAAQAIDEAQGAMDAEAALKEAADEAQGAADAEEAMKSPAETIGSDAISKVASAVVSNRNDASYINGFKKKAEEMGVEPSELARYIVEQSK